MGIGHFFSEYYGEKLIKPNPNAYIQACGKNKPDECIMVGDDLFLDIECASKNGLHTIFVNTKNINENINTLTVNKVEDINEELIQFFNKKMKS